MDYKLVLSIIAVGIGVIGYIPYFLDIFKGKTKPHAFSWLIWGILTGIGFLAQYSKGGGAGAWVTLFTSIVCFTIAFISFFKGEKDIKTFDWICLLGAFLGIALWGITNNPLTAIIIIILVDATAYAPTFRKAYFKPFEETVITYALDSLKFVFAIAALESYSPTTYLYPLALIILNASFTIMVLIRRKTKWGI
ncbi:MAG: hypothetical protein ABH803_00880 [Candidatus Micrarchaeota archaeon]